MGHVKRLSWTREGKRDLAVKYWISDRFAVLQCSRSQSPQIDRHPEYAETARTGCSVSTKRRPSDFRVRYKSWLYS